MSQKNLNASHRIQVGFSDIMKKKTWFLLRAGVAEGTVWNLVATEFVAHTCQKAGWQVKKKDSWVFLDLCP